MQGSTHFKKPLTTRDFSAKWIRWSFCEFIQLFDFYTALSHIFKISNMTGWKRLSLLHVEFFLIGQTRQSRQSLKWGLLKIPGDVVEQQRYPMGPFQFP